MKEKKEETNKNLPLKDIGIFFAIWDEERGPIVLDAQPPNKHDYELLAVRIFAAFQFFWDNPENKFKKTQMTLPINNIDRKARILLDVIQNNEVRGGLQPFITVILVPDYISDKDLEKFDKILSKISRGYTFSEKLDLLSYFQILEEIYMKIMNPIEKKEEIEELYSYTAAVEDFRGGIELFKAKNFKQAYHSLQKALTKFTRENHESLIMEASYLLGTLFVQQKKFNPAIEYFINLDKLTTKTNSQKYNETAPFMLGYCYYKTKNFYKADEILSKLERRELTNISKLQYFTIFGRVLAEIRDFDKSILMLKSAIHESKNLNEGLVKKTQQAQLYYDLGITFYKKGIYLLKKEGIYRIEGFQNIFLNAITNLKESEKIWDGLSEIENSIALLRNIGEIHEILRENIKALDYYKRALNKSLNNDNLQLLGNLITKLIQSQKTIGIQKEDIEYTKKILNRAKNQPLMDAFLLASLRYQFGSSLLSTERHKKKGINQLIIAENLLRNFKTPFPIETQILNELIDAVSQFGIKIKLQEYKNRLEKIKEKSDGKSPFKRKFQDYLADVKEIWIFSKSEGILFFNYSPISDMDNDLLGGFLTAMQALSQELTYSEMNSMVYGQERFSIYQEENRDFYLLGRSNIKTPESRVNNILSTIYKRFWKEFSNELENFKGNVTIFGKFTNILKSFDWTFLK